LSLPAAAGASMGASARAPSANAHGLARANVLQRHTTGNLPALVRIMSIK
jgi:hypothetical protein